MHIEYWWGKSEVKRALGKQRRRLVNNIKMDSTCTEFNGLGKEPSDIKGGT
jgi:hypothetical protein